MKSFLDSAASEAVGDPMRVSEGRTRSLPKRFYKRATAEPADGAFVLSLDGKPARTPGRKALSVENEAVASALADEWEAQRERIDPLSMPITRLVNSALDGVAGNEDAVRADILAFVQSDLLLYRASDPEELAARQETAWGGTLGRFEQDLDVNFMLAAGVMPVEQPSETVERFAQYVSRFGDPLMLAATHLATTLTGSALLALSLHAYLADADAVWTAAHVDEDWNIERWGEDDEAMARRAARKRDFDAAATVIQALRTNAPA